MRPMLHVGVVLGVLCAATNVRGAETRNVAQGGTADTPQALFRNYEDFTWSKILPDLGESSPEICILGVDPKTQATKLMIRAPKGIHVRNIGIAPTKRIP